jgi:hypothetical protein
MACARWQDNHVAGRDLDLPAIPTAETHRGAPLRHACASCSAWFGRCLDEKIDWSYGCKFIA